MKTFIVPIDFSDESMTGLELALMLANKNNANVQMVHVITSFTNIERGSLENEHEQVKKKFEGLIQKYKSRTSENVSLEYIVKEGRVFKEVTNQAESFENSVLVLSTHGGSGLEELFIGSNAYRIAAATSKPVITIRSFQTVKTIKKIVLSLDITEQTKEKVPYTVKLAKIFNSEIHLVTLRSSNLKSIEKKLNRSSEQVGEFLKNHDVQFTVDHLQGNNFTDLTLDYAKSVNADLISIMTEQEKNASNLLLGNFAHQMINKSLIPVLSFPTHHIGKILDNLRTQGIYYY